MQYVGQTDVAGTTSVSAETHTEEKPTQEERLVRIPMNQALNRRVGRLVEGIEGKFGMIRDHHRLHREELTDDGIMPRIFPVDSTEDIRPALVVSIPTA